MRSWERSRTYGLIVIRDQIGNGGTRVLNLNPSVRTEGVEGEGTVVVQLVSSVLPQDEGGDTTRIGRVRVVSVLSLFEKSVIGAAKWKARNVRISGLSKFLKYPKRHYSQRITDAGRGGVGKGEVLRVAEALYMRNTDMQEQNAHKGAIVSESISFLLLRYLTGFPRQQ